MLLWRLWHHPQGTMGSLGGHQESFIFGLSDLRTPVLVSLALNFIRLDVLWIWGMFVPSRGLPGSTQGRCTLLLGKSVLTYLRYSQCWMPQWPQRVPEGRQLWAGKQGLRSTLCLWLSCSGLSAQNRHGIILRAGALQPVFRGAVKFPYLRTVECFGVLRRDTFSAVSPTPQCFSQMLFARKLPGFGIQVRCWMKKTFFPTLL